VYAQHTLKAGPGGYGALMSAWGLGAVAGSAAYARWRRRTTAILIAGSGLSLAAGFAVLAVAPTLVVAVIGAALAGMGNGVESIAAKTAVQEQASEQWMALVMSLNDSISQLAPGLGILLGGVITALATSRVAFGVAAAGSLAFALAVPVVLRWAGGTRGDRPPPTGPGADEDEAEAGVPGSRSFV
jgi:MFS family permease